MLWRLIGQSDLLIEGFRPGVFDKLGFGYEAVRHRHPSLIYCSVSGFGDSGPYSDQPVFDPIIQALAGWAGIQKEQSEPRLVKGMVADKVSALTNAHAMLAALVKSARTGEGSRLQLTMLDANLTFNWPDGWVSITSGNDRQWQAMCEAFNRDDLLHDERFATTAARAARMDEWMSAIQSMVEDRPVGQVIHLLREAEVPVAPVLEPAEVHRDPQVCAANCLRVVTHPVLGRMRLPSPASAYFGLEVELSPSPTHGQHTWAVLEALGYGEEEIDGLEATGAAGVRVRKV